jgi:hypothetical protein
MEELTKIHLPRPQGLPAAGRGAKNRTSLARELGAPRYVTNRIIVSYIIESVKWNGY